MHKVFKNLPSFYPSFASPMSVFRVQGALFVPVDHSSAIQYKVDSQGQVEGVTDRVDKKMSHLSREKLDLVNRTKKVVGQLEAVERALNEDESCSEVLHRLAAAKGAINSLMAELMEDHIRNHMPHNTKSSEDATDDLIEIVRTYLK
jgi:DNA-binding FrmR family transcriptional regulator